MRHVLTLFVVLFLIGAAFAQPDFEILRAPQEPLINGHDNMFFLDANKGWLVGNNATILYTPDAGQTWVAQSYVMDSDTAYNDVQFVDDNTGYAAADDGFVWKTTDGGATWTEINPGITTSNINCLWAVDANVVYFGSDDGVVIKTEDGGATFLDQTVTAASTSDIDDIYAFDANHVIGMSGGNDAVIVSSTDGGATWNNTTVPFPPTGISQRQYAIIGMSGGVAYTAAYHGNVFKTTDYGATWTNVANFFGGAYKYFTGIAVYNDHVWAGGSEGKLYHSGDAGATWDTLFFPTAQQVEYIKAFDENNLYVLGGNGQLMETTDGGATWSPMLTWPNLSLYTIDAPTTNKILAGSIYGADITMSNDGGATWSYPMAANGDVIGGLLDITFQDENNGFWVGRSGQIFKTTDGGATWVVKPNSQYIFGNTKSYYFVTYIDATHIIAGGSSGIIQLSSDGGETWTEGTVGASATLYDCEFIDANTGIISGSSGRIYRTTDGGATWTEVDDLGTMTMRSVEFIDANVGFISASSGYLFKTTDGGATWTQLAQLVNANAPDDDPDLYQIIFVNATTGYMCGEDAAIYQTTDAGDNWTQLGIPADLPLVTLQGMTWPSETIGFISTDDGYLLATGLTGIETPENVAQNYRLNQNYPNPFNPETAINFNIPQSRNVSLVVYNTLGQEVRTLYSGSMTAGTHTLRWDSRNNAGQLMPSGIYFYKLKAGDFIQVKKMMLMK